MNGYDLGAVLREQLQGQTAPAGTARDIETITAEIIQRKQNAGSEILAIGNCLIEAKGMLSEGEWLMWLSDRVDFSPRTAQRFMRLAKEWTDATALSHLGATKALTLLALPPEERESFMAENHIVNGQEKNVIDMTSRELEKAIRERDEARTAAETARAEARNAEESRAKIEADMRALEDIHRSAQESEAQARSALAEARKELQALRDKPVDVAVETVVDDEAVKKAREDAVAEMTAKVNQAEAARKEAEKKREAAEEALAEARQKLEETEKASPFSADADLAAFKLLFDQAQVQVNQLHGLLLEVRGRDEEAAGKFQNALLALADAVRRCAE